MAMRSRWSADSASWHGHAHRRLSCALLIGCLTALALASGEAAPASAADQCDRNLLAPSTSPLAYRLRGDRCEGLYVEEVSGSAILIASWTEAFDDFEIARSPKLTVVWDAPEGAGPVRLRAQGLRRRLYYRMDTVRPAGDSSFDWPTDLLAELRIPRQDLGVVALAMTPVSGAEREVYLPLRIAQGSPPARSGSYRLAILPGTELGEVYVTLARVTEPSRTRLKDGEPLGYGYYPANRPFEITVTGLDAKGFYQLTIGATLKGGGATTTDAWFYHPGN